MSAERPVPLSDEDAAYVHSGKVPYRYRRWLPVDVERVILATMARWGWTRDAAWRSVRASHPNAFQLLRRCPEDFDDHWLKAGGHLHVVAVDSAPEEHPRIEPRELSRLLAAAMGQMWGRLHQIPRRARPRAVQVSLAVIARCASQGTLRVGVPLRSVQLDTGMRSRGAVLEGLREAAILLGQLHASFDPRTPLTSSHELEILVEREGVAGGPLGITHPLPTLWTGSAPAIIDWVGLPGDAPLVWAGLLSLGGNASRIQLADLVAAGEASRQTRRTVKRVLEAMAERGLVKLTTRRVRLGEEYRPDPPEALLQRVVAERRLWAFRCHTFDLIREGRTQDQLDRQRAWWLSLPEEERDARRKERQAWFAALPCDEQDHYRLRWARQRQRAGFGIAETHQRWCEDHLTRDRRRARRLWYRTQPQPRQLELVARWEQWRLTHRVGRYKANRLEEVEQVVPASCRPPREPRWPDLEWEPDDGERVESEHAGQTDPVQNAGPHGGDGGHRPAGPGGGNAPVPDGRLHAVLPNMPGR